MYKTQICAWGEEFQKNTRKRNRDKKTKPPTQPPGHAKRTRPTALPPKQGAVAASVIVGSSSIITMQSIPKPFTARQHKVHEEILHAMGGSIKSLFDKANIKGRWGWDEFGFTTSAEVSDHSTTWKLMADRCHGASTLCQARCPDKAFAALAGVRETLARVVGEHGPWLFVYLWRIVLLVRGISERLSPSKHAFLGSFLVFLRRLIRQHLGSGHQLARFLGALIRVPVTQLRSALEMVYGQAIDKFALYLGATHPAVLAMRSHFFMYWKGRTLGAGAYAHYGALVRRADAVLGPHDARALALRTEYMYAAFYHGHDLALTRELALELQRRTQSLLVPGPDHHDDDGDPPPPPPPAWSRATYAYVLSSKLLAHVDQARGSHAGCHARLRDLAQRLRGGDDECRTRAAQVHEMLARRCRLFGEPGDDAEGERRLAANIRGTLPGAGGGGSEVAWGGEWTLDWSARHHRAHIEGKKKGKAARKRRRREAKAAAARRAVAEAAEHHQQQQVVVGRGGSRPPFEYVRPQDLVLCSQFG